MSVKVIGFNNMKMQGDKVLGQGTMLYFESTFYPFENLIKVSGLKFKELFKKTIIYQLFLIFKVSIT
ncbi:MAG TPA: hypothetical protein VIK81_05155 [Patescibacteria group bacterium]